MMTLLDRVKMLVKPYLSEDSMDMGYNRFEVVTDSLVLELEFEHYVDNIYPRGEQDVVVEPKKVIAFQADINGEFNTEEDLTEYFESYRYYLN